MSQEPLYKKVKDAVLSNEDKAAWDSIVKEHPETIVKVLALHHGQIRRKLLKRSWTMVMFQAFWMSMVMSHAYSAFSPVFGSFAGVVMGAALCLLVDRVMLATGQSIDEFVINKAIQKQEAENGDNNRSDDS